MQLSPKEQKAERERKDAFNKRKEEIKAAIMADDTLKFRFKNNEFPGKSITFNLEGIFFTFEDGKDYDIPLCVVDHINGLMIPDPQYELEMNPNSPAYGQIRLVSDKAVSRFTLHPVGSIRQQMEAKTIEAGMKTA